MFDRMRTRVARWLAPAAKTSQRMYAGAKQSRLTTGWGTSVSSADGELVTSLTSLRSRARALTRDAPYAKRAKVIVQSNIIGAGIGMQAQVKNMRDALIDRVNDDIETTFVEWSRAPHCHTGGVLHFHDLERLAMGEVFDAGEVLIRKHYAAFGTSRVPFALEIIEPERLADDYAVPGPLASGNIVRMGVETDRYHRPAAYWLREGHPGDIRWGERTPERLERVSAEQIIHLRLIDRWPQTRGEPWLHAVMRKLNDLDGYSEAEIVAARAAASYVGFIQSPEEQGELQADGAREMTLEPGILSRLAPGETFTGYSPSRPNSGADPFLRFMLREAAAGTLGVSYESLSRDYSQSNYSSSRLALIDDRDLWRMLQLWFIRNLREPLHREWLQQAVLARAIGSIGIDQYALDPRKFEAVRFKPRGWSWIDPTKEVAAYKEAVRGGFTTASDVIALTGAGRDIEDVLDERRRELDLMAEKDLKFDTEYEEKAPPVPPPDDAPPDDDDEATNNPDPPRRVFSFPR